LYSELRRAVNEARADYLLLPFGDPHTTVMGLFSLLGRGGFPNGCGAEVCLHFGRGAGLYGIKDRLRDFYKEYNLRVCGWNKIHVINVLYYDRLKARGGPVCRRLSFLPHAIAANPRLAKAESRRRLGIPEEGRYVGVAGMIDRRKAIDELLAAYRSVAATNERLLIAGQIDPVHLPTIRNKYGDLVEKERLILVNRFLSQAEFRTALTAMDVVCTPYPHFAGLSEMLLQAVAAGRPVLANDYGWSRAMIKRFGLGWTCDVHAPESFARTLRAAFDQSADYKESEAVSRLVAFHSPENYAETWLQGIRERMGLPASSDIKPWSWVLEAVEEGRRLLTY
jgi:glycosyltransferase involved in cell wall biosynthesis